MRNKTNISLLKNKRYSTPGQSPGPVLPKGRTSFVSRGGRGITPLRLQLPRLYSKQVLNHLAHFRNKKFYQNLILTLLAFVFSCLTLAIIFYQLPAWEKAETDLKKEYTKLETKKNNLFDSYDINKTLNKYNLKTSYIKAFIKNRENTFYIEAGDHYDFFPDIANKILPSIKRILHKDIEIEGISINDKAEILMPIIGPNYTIIAKQYGALKKQLGSDTTPLIIDIKLNTFNRQEIEILEKTKSGNFAKKKRKVVKAVINGKINPNYFTKKPKNKSIEQNYNQILKPGINTKKENAKNIKQIILNIWNNAIKDLKK